MIIRKYDSVVYNIFYIHVWYDIIRGGIIGAMVFYEIKCNTSVMLIIFIGIFKKFKRWYKLKSEQTFKAILGFFKHQTSLNKRNASQWLASYKRTGKTSTKLHIEGTSITPIKITWVGGPVEDTLSLWALFKEVSGSNMTNCKYVKLI